MDNHQRIIKTQEENEVPEPRKVFSRVGAVHTYPNRLVSKDTRACPKKQMKLFSIPKSSENPLKTYKTNDVENIDTHQQKYKPREWASHVGVIWVFPGVEHFCLRPGVRNIMASPGAPLV